MLNLKDDIQPLTTFRNNSVAMMKQLKKTGRPIILTVNGKTEAIVQSAESYQRLLDIAADADVMEAVRQGRADVAAGRTRPAAEVLASFRKKHGLSR
ncbi:MAG: type II toxin-antitoxin system Phd/YefM family antitoxin [Acidobacteriota bacterium]|nr:type II toxin-antitoxin system Phd/YefM family antitoxin [Acidobacteriota bacterium]